MDAAGQHACPNCGAELVANAGFVTWCGRCDWNLNAPPVELRGRLDNLALAAARRLDERLSAQLVSRGELRPHLTTAKAGAYGVAALVHLFTLALAAGGVALLVTSYANPFADLLALAAIAFAFVLRPRLGKRPTKGIVGRSEAPALYRLVDDTAAALRTKSVDQIVVDGRFNAAWDVTGLRRSRTLTLGLPLAHTLEPEQLVALVAHELAHGRNGDSTRGLFVGSAVNALQEIYDALRGSGGSVVFSENAALLELAARPLLWALSLPVLAVLLAEHLLLQRDSQRAEYLADALAADVAGTAAVIGLHEALLNEASFEMAIQRVARDKDGDVFESLRLAMTSLPEQERERRRRVARREDTRLTATHPPTGRRIALLEQRAATPAKIELSDSDIGRIEKELAAARRTIGEQLLDDYRASLY